MRGVPALLASALAGLLVGAVLAGGSWPVAAVAVVQVVLVLGVARTDLAPAVRASGAVAGVAGVAGAVAVSVRVPGEAPDSLLPLAAVVGLGLVAMALVQLARRDGRGRLTASLTAGVLMLVLVAAAGVWVGAGVYPSGPAALLAALAGLAVAVAFAVFPGPRWLWVAGGTVAAVGVGLLVHSYAPQAADAALGAVPAALVAGAAGLAGWAGLGVARWLVEDEGSRDAGAPSPAAAAAAADDGAIEVLNAPPLAGPDATPDGRPALASTLLSAALPLVLSAPVVFAVGWLVVD